MSEIKTIGVAGAGTMGAGIAIVCARAGFRTRVFDLRPEALDTARKQTEAFLKKSVERGKLAAEKLPEIMDQWGIGFGGPQTMPKPEPDAGLFQPSGV